MRERFRAILTNNGPSPIRGEIFVAQISIEFSQLRQERHRGSRNMPPLTELFVRRFAMLKMCRAAGAQMQTVVTSRRNNWGLYGMTSLRSFKQHFLLAALVVERVFLGGFQHVQEVGGFEQARRGDVIGAGGVQARACPPAARRGR